MNRILVIIVVAILLILLMMIDKIFFWATLVFLGGIFLVNPKRITSIGKSKSEDGTHIQDLQLRTLAYMLADCLYRTRAERQVINRVREVYIQTALSLYENSPHIYDYADLISSDKDVTPELNKDLEEIAWTFNSLQSKISATSFYKLFANCFFSVVPPALHNKSLVSHLQQIALKKLQMSLVFFVSIMQELAISLGYSFDSNGTQSDYFNYSDTESDYSRYGGNSWNQGSGQTTEYHKALELLGVDDNVTRDELKKVKKRLLNK